MRSFDAYEAAGWEQRAAAYADFLGPVTARLAEALLDAAAVGPGTRVVDVGSGPGDVTAACAARGGHALGVDIAERMVARARANHPALDFVVGDAHRLPVPDGSQDAVVGNFVMPHLGDPAAAVAGFVRALVPGGRLALSTWDRPDRARIVGVFVEAVAAAGASPPPDLPEGPGFFQYADPDRFGDLLRAAGLSDITVRTVHFVQRFAGADELWDGLLGGTVRTRDLILRQPPEVQARIRIAYGDRVAAYANADGAVDLPVSVRVASGRKE